jgi:hypothetical protein
MGSSASLNNDNPKIYKSLPCGCIYSCQNDTTFPESSEETKDEYENSEYKRKNIELICCCYSCLDTLKKKSFDKKPLNILYSETRNMHIFQILEDSSLGWMSQIRALEYAEEKGLKSFDECINNKNVLNNYKNY